MRRDEMHLVKLVGPENGRSFLRLILAFANGSKLPADDQLYGAHGH